MAPPNQCSYYLTPTNLPTHPQYPPRSPCAKRRLLPPGPHPRSRRVREVSPCSAGTSAAAPSGPKLFLLRETRGRVGRGVAAVCAGAPRAPEAEGVRRRSAGSGPAPSPTRTPAHARGPGSRQAECHRRPARHLSLPCLPLTAPPPPPPLTPRHELPPVSRDGVVRAKGAHQGAAAGTPHCTEKHCGAV